VVILVFGTKKLRGMGSDLGGAIKDFKEGMKTDEKDSINQDRPASDERKEVS
jgi:sec-independent protein translocase protein TatA